MKTCKHIQRKLSAYQDGELGTADREQIARHLEKCAVCTESYRQLQNMWLTLDVLSSSEPQPFAATRIQARLSDAVQRRHAWPAKLALATTVASAIVIGCLTGAQWQFSQEMAEQKSVQEWANELGLESLSDAPENSLVSLYFDSDMTLQGDQP